MTQDIWEALPRRKFVIVSSGRVRAALGIQDTMSRCVNCRHPHLPRPHMNSLAVAQMPYYLCRALPAEPCGVCECADEVVPIEQDAIDPKG